MQDRLVELRARLNVYQHGSKFAAPELVQRVTGAPPGVEPFVRYLRRKYGELYDL